MKKAKLLLCSIAIFTFSLQSCVNKGETSSSSISQSSSTSTSTNTSESSVNKKITKFELVGDKTSLKEGEVVTLSVNVEGENLTQEDKNFTISIEKGVEFIEKLTDLTYKGKKVSKEETVSFKLTSTFDSTKVANFSLNILPTKEVSAVSLTTDKEVYRVNDTIVLSSVVEGVWLTEEDKLVTYTVTKGAEFISSTSKENEFLVTDKAKNGSEITFKATSNFDETKFATKTVSIRVVSISDVTLTSNVSGVDAISGGKVIFTARVNSEDTLTSEEQQVDYEVIEGKDKITAEGITAGGVILVKENASVGTIKVKATSKIDKTKFAEASVQVLPRVSLDIKFSSNLKATYFYDNNGSYAKPILGEEITDLTKVKASKRVVVNLVDDETKQGNYKFTLKDPDNDFTDYSSKTVNGVELFFAKASKQLLIDVKLENISLDLTSYVEEFIEIEGTYTGYDVINKKAVSFSLLDNKLTVDSFVTTYTTSKDSSSRTTLKIGYRTSTFFNNILVLDLYDTVYSSDTINCLIIASKDIPNFSIENNEVITDGSLSSPDVFGKYTSNDVKHDFFYYDGNFLLEDDFTTEYEKTSFTDSSYAVVKSSLFSTNVKRQKVRLDFSIAEDVRKFKVVKTDSNVLSGNYKLEGKDDLVLDGFGSNTTKGKASLGNLEGSYTYTYKYNSPYVINLTFEDGNTRYFEIDNKNFTYVEVIYINKDVFTTATTFTSEDGKLLFTFENGNVTVEDKGHSSYTIKTKSTTYTISKSVISFKLEVEYESGYYTSSDNVTFEFKITDETPTSIIVNKNISVYTEDYDEISILTQNTVLTKVEGK